LKESATWKKERHMPDNAGSGGFLSAYITNFHRGSNKNAISTDRVPASTIKRLIDSGRL
jgi:hypothetical protein